MGQPEESDRRSEVAAASGDAANRAGERLELYKLAVEMADRVSARRGTANAFFLTLNTALVGLAGLSGETAGAALISIAGYRVPVLALTGLVLAAAWWLLLRSYRDLNEAKFKVINAIEEDLVAHPFRDEWRYLKEDPVKPLRKRYAELGVLEQLVPAAFAVLYVLIGAGAVCG